MCNNFIVIYIGPYNDGTTSKMRGDCLRQLLNTDKFYIINTQIPFFSTSVFWRSIGFRYKKGLFIKKINKYIVNQINRILEELSSSNKQVIDMIWIDKAAFITSWTTQFLKKKTRKLIHFTPDMAFYANKSVHFINSIGIYDYLITTKSSEKQLYTKYTDQNKIIMTTQGYDDQIHKRLVPFSKKEKNVAFVGLYEPSRKIIVQKLIENNINVKLAGIGWNSFIKRNQNNQYLHYFGEYLLSNKYTEFISKAYFGLGLLSKKFPEMHTTRTMEIPACGTALITERNKETSFFFNDDEVIFYSTVEEAIEKILFYLNHTEELELITLNGYKKISSSGFDYKSLLAKILKDIEVIT